MHAKAQSEISRRRKTQVIAKNASIEVTVEGDGIPVLFLPSRGRDSYEYNDIAHGLAQRGFFVMRPQPRGIGASSGPTESLNLHELASDVAAVISTLSQSAYVVGHAYGHFVARTLAADQPNLVRGVVLAAAGSRYFPTWLSDLVSTSADITQPDQIRKDAIRQAFFAQSSDPTPWFEGWYPEVAKYQRVANANTEKSDWWGVAGCPILDLQAAEDPFRPAKTRNELVEKFGKLVDVRVIESASHALFPEQPTAVCQEIADWIESQEANINR